MASLKKRGAVFTSSTTRGVGSIASALAPIRSRSRREKLRQFESGQLRGGDSRRNLIRW
jgi:hypothetical protein